MSEPDPRLAPPGWSAAPERWRASLRRIRILGPFNLALAAWYFGWLLHPDRIGHPVLYAALVAAELFNLVQAAGFWWTCAHQRARPPSTPLPGAPVDVDVFVPVYDEPVDVVEATVAGAARMTAARVRLHVLDDGGNPEVEELAVRHGAAYVRRTVRAGAKAGNLNHALARTSAPFVAVFDCDHVPDPDFLERTLGHFVLGRTAFVQTPQYYANARATDVAGAAWAQQALFFGPIARGKDGLEAMICCGTNVVFRREALQEAGGFPEGSLTEDFELSLRLHERGWTSAYLPEVLARGLGPEDMASYAGQQSRWARGCISAIPKVLRARLPWRVRLQYLLSGMFFLTGWTFLVYMSLPVIRLLTGAQPLAGASADQFLLHFAPYYAGALMAVAVAGGGSYTFAAFALTAATFWVQVRAGVVAVLRRPGRFVVTPKRGSGKGDLSTAAPALAVIAVLVLAAAWGLLQDRSAATLNNVAFAALHVALLSAGARPALRRARPARAREVEQERTAA